LTRPLLQVESLRVEIADSGLDIVDEVSFAVAAGEVLGLVGESGSGKTTVGLALLGHCRRGARIAHGSLHIGERDIFSLPASELRKMRGRIVSYVPQDPTAALNPALRVGRQLEETLAAHDFGSSTAARHARVEEVLEEVLLADDPVLLRRYPHQLSGGQQQRVALAMAFACRPRVIVLDEPTTGLDVTTQAHVLETVRKLCAAHGVAALYISHDLTVVAALAHSVAVMYAGRLVETGPQRQLFRSSAHPYTRRLVQAIPDVSGRYPLVGIPGRAPPPARRPHGCFFAPRCDFAVDECRAEFPPVERIDASHRVRCFRFQDVLAESVRTRVRLEAAERRQNGNESLLSTRELRAFYSGREILHGVSLDVWAGECLALVGESGSGKTTLARCVAGLHRDWTGEVLLGRTQLAPGARARNSATRQAIQYIFQNPYSSLNPRKTVGQIVAQPLNLFLQLPRQKLEQRVAEMLEHVALDVAYADRHPDQLSGGERQRVAIARALAAEPSVLICDEVTSALDVSVQATIIELLHELQREMALGLLFITHNLGLCRAIAHDVAVMREGRIVELGTADEVLGAPRAEYTRRLLVDTPSLDTPLAAVGPPERAGGRTG
jgi:peptide/nickel transport system ATP-binding protein